MNLVAWAAVFLGAGLLTAVAAVLLVVFDRALEPLNRDSTEEREVE